MTIKTCAIALLSVAALSVSASARDQIKIVGSSTVYPFTSYVAEEFKAVTGNPTPVVESTGTGGGMKLFCAGDGLDTPDFTNASRPIKADEFAICVKNGVTDITGMMVGFDGIAVADAIRANALGHHFIQLIDRSDVEVRAFVAQQVDDFNRRVGLDGVVHLGEFETGAQVIVGLADHRGVDHHERGFLLVGERLHFVKSGAREIIFDVDRHAGNS